MKLETSILDVLSGERLSALDILNKINQHRTIPFSLGSLYPPLNRLEKKGFIESNWGEEEEGAGGARRKYYKKVDRIGEITP
ncbi:MAG: helix-turn-helix transcriptional regulator [Calothrix sp. MO_167.B42]|nr:helix-turn-helix transcriptional regulator [Calothrix sp. MO_167.B42]